MKKSVGRVHDTGINGEAPKSVEDMDRHAHVVHQESSDRMLDLLLEHHAAHATDIRQKPGTESPRTMMRPGDASFRSSMGYDL